ncbi:MAG: anti-sigma factor [Chloroflexi bacterium]|nr:anti-sigma factor [Chloroflexota bacterium]
MNEAQDLDPRFRQLFAQLREQYPPRDPQRAAETEARLQALFAQAREAARQTAPAARQAPRRGLRWRWRIAWAWALVLLFALGLSVPWRAAVHAQPGTPLYPLKLWTERAQLWLTHDPAREAELHLRFAQARLEEARLLLQQGDLAALEPILQELHDHLHALQDLDLQGALPNAERLARLHEAINTDLAITAATAAPPVREAFLEQLRSLAPGLFVGPLEEKAPQQWRVGGRPVYIHPSTQIFGIPQIGDLVEVHGYPLDDGSWIAQSVRVAARVRAHQSASVEFVGRLEGQQGDRWVVNGLTLQAGPTADIQGHPNIGDWVEVEAVWDARKQAWILWHLEPVPGAYGTEVEFVGRVTQKQGNIWWVEGLPVWIVRETRRDPEDIPLGARVLVHAWRRADGSLVAEEVYILPEEPAPTPTPRDEHPVPSP